MHFNINWRIVMAIVAGLILASGRYWNTDSGLFFSGYGTAVCLTLASAWIVFGLVERWTVRAQGILFRLGDNCRLLTLISVLLMLIGLSIDRIGWHESADRVYAASMLAGVIGCGVFIVYSCIGFARATVWALGQLNRSV